MIIKMASGFKYYVPEIPEELKEPQTAREEKLLQIIKEYSTLLTKDFATGLSHREEFFRQVKDQVGIYIYLDGDNLKTINDISKNHQMGDRAIKEFASAIEDAIGIEMEKAIKESLRGGIIPSRLGGDEFSIFIPGVESLEIGEKIATRILEQIRKKILKGTNSTGEPVSFPLTASIGVGRTPELADAALYQAKEKGRDRVEVNSQESIEKAAYLKLKKLYKQQKYNLIT